MTSILESEYVAPTRPYSQDELAYLRQKLYQRLRIGKHRVEHRKSGYFYYAKQNSRKEKELQESNTTDVGNCSVSWKISKTPGHLRDQTIDLAEVYCRTFYEEPQYMTYEKYDLEKTFYLWLYEPNV